MMGQENIQRKLRDACSERTFCNYVVSDYPLNNTARNNAVCVINVWNSKLQCQYGAELLFLQIKFTRRRQLVDIVMKALIYKY